MNEDGSDSLSEGAEDQLIDIREDFDVFATSCFLGRTWCTIEDEDERIAKVIKKKLRLAPLCPPCLSAPSNASESMLGGQRIINSSHQQREPAKNVRAQPGFTSGFAPMEFRIAIKKIKQGRDNFV